MSNESGGFLFCRRCGATTAFIARRPPLCVLCRAEDVAYARGRAEERADVVAQLRYDAEHMWDCGYEEPLEYAFREIENAEHVGAAAKAEKEKSDD